MTEASNTPKDGVTAFGFRWGPMLVERSVSDDEVGWILTVRDEKGVARAEVRVTPKGRKWRVREFS